MGVARLPAPPLSNSPFSVGPRRWYSSDSQGGTPGPPRRRYRVIAAAPIGPTPPAVALATRCGTVEAPMRGDRVFAVIGRVQLKPIERTKRSQ